MQIFALKMSVLFLLLHLCTKEHTALSERNSSISSAHQLCTHLLGKCPHHKAVCCSGVLQTAPAESVAMHGKQVIRKCSILYLLKLYTWKKCQTLGLKIASSRLLRQKKMG